MISDLENVPVSVAIAVDWSTRLLEGESGLFMDDPDLTDRVENVSQAVIDCGLMGNREIAVHLLMVLGVVPPKIHGPIMIKLGQSDPESLSAGMRELSKGGESQLFSHRSLVETLGRISRHGMMVDVIEDDEIQQEVREAIEKAKRMMR